MVEAVVSLGGFQRGEGQLEKGFAPMAAVTTVCILIYGVWYPRFYVTTQDVRISSGSIGGKEAFSGAGSGRSWLLQNFNRTNLNASAINNKLIAESHPTLIDPKSTFTISTPTVPTKGSASLPSQGYASGGGETWGQTRHMATFTNKNTTITPISD